MVKVEQTLTRGRLALRKRITTNSQLAPRVLLRPTVEGLRFFTELKAHQHLFMEEGDFLVQSRHSSSATRQRLVIAIRTKDAIKRIDLKRGETGIRLGGKTFPSLKKMVEHYSREPIVLQGGEELLLKKAVPKGKYQLVHSDVRLLKKIGSGAYGTVYRGQLIRDNNKTIAVKRIDSEGTDDQGRKS
ncbi:unnamed protein product [Strongylus vulgaris]|uniref:Protein kinase domain-containing protein n=1 Tax=Strongylus vulgaris TaxID=40348 RepID=A0A3P7IDL1_STRVU|nr:unnamed protein product [Strongylus vulgaris]